MKILESIILFINSILWLLLVMLLTVIKYQLGFTGLLFFFLFLVLYFNAEYFIISKRNKFSYSRWIIFIGKLYWANRLAFTLLVITSMILVQLL